MQEELEMFEEWMEHGCFHMQRKNKFTIFENDYEQQVVFGTIPVVFFLLVLRVLLY